jgi:hypothetical protein
VRRIAIGFITLGAVAWHGVASAQFRPLTSKPEIIETLPDEACVKEGAKLMKEAGKVKCRWGGSCTKVRTACYSCGIGTQWHAGLQACYSCPSGTTLQQANVSEEWVWLCR